MKTTTTFLAAAAFAVSALIPLHASADEGFAFVHFSELAKRPSSAPEAHHAPAEAAAPRRTTRADAIRTGCAHLGLNDLACRWYCISGERDGQYFDVWCQTVQDGPTPGGTDWSRTTCDATVYVDMASGAILPVVQGDNRSWKSDDGFTCATERHEAPSGGWSPIPF